MKIKETEAIYYFPSFYVVANLVNIKEYHVSEGHTWDTVVGNSYSYNGHLIAEDHVFHINTKRSKTFIQYSQRTRIMEYSDDTPNPELIGEVVKEIKP